VTTRTTYYQTVHDTPLSLLTERTNARYLRCLRSRKHRPGDELTRPRPLPGGESFRFPICPECGVPVTGKLVTWNGHL
jgi:hypothetical protein